MKKSTKGALAGGAAAFLLLGGAGSLAYWTDNADVNGTTVESGHLAVINNDCGTADWELDNSGGAIAPSTRIVPGDTITKTCSFEIDGEGDHFDNVGISIASPGFTAGSDATLVSKLGTVSASYKDHLNNTVASGATLNVGEVVTASFSFTFDPNTPNHVAENAVATLDTIAITVTQNHN